MKGRSRLDLFVEVGRAWRPSPVFLFELKLYGASSKRHSSSSISYTEFALTPNLSRHTLLPPNLSHMDSPGGSAGIH